MIPPLRVFIPEESSDPREDVLHTADDGGDALEEAEDATEVVDDARDALDQDAHGLVRVPDRVRRRHLSDEYKNA